VRFGIALDAPPEPDAIERLVAQAQSAESAGIEIAWLDSSSAGEALISAAAVAARTTVVRLAACVTVGGHPLEIAESASVADNCSNGRLILVLEELAGDADLLAETVDVVLAGTAPRPFRHDGPRWHIPANLPENDQGEERIIVTPFVVQTELPVWLIGPAAADAARSRGLAHVARGDDGTQVAEQEWTATEAALGRTARRLRRPLLQFLETDDSGRFDVDAVVDRLRADRQAWGMDTAVFRLPASLDDDARAHAVHRLSSLVRPRIVMNELPAGLEQHWKEALA
jgi:alkanesulfonate monooxygenase SsuD/methylene tetrahydromethanopterin reductase-like flavin-dependent oxidoreductase (luciferase family)